MKFFSSGEDLNYLLVCKREPENSLPYKVLLEEKNFFFKYVKYRTVLFCFDFFLLFSYIQNKINLTKLNLTIKKNKCNRNFRG